MPEHWRVENCLHLDFKLKDHKNINMNKNGKAYFLARVIQFVASGIQQVY